MTVRLLRWLDARQLVNATILAGGTGPALSALEAFGDLLLIEPPPNGTSLYCRLRRRIAKARAERFVRRHGPYDLVYSSTLTTGRILRLLDPSTPVISRVSELDHWLRTKVDPTDLRFSLKRSHHFIAVSIAVRNNLIATHGVPPEVITVLPGYVEDLPSLESLGNQRNAARAELGLPEEGFVVGGIGTTDWRKGVDLFLQVAFRCSQLEVPASFVWIGGSGGEARAQLEFDAANAGITNVQFFDARPDASILAAAFDLLCLPSREDPYPVVMLECGAVGVPTLSFAGSGGAEEFVARGGGVTVPYLDVAALAQSIERLAVAPNELEPLGGTARQLVADHHTVDVVANEIYSLMTLLAHDRDSD